MSDSRGTLRRAERRATRRLRLRAALGLLARILPLPLAYAAGALALAKLGLLSPSGRAWIGLALLVALVLGCTLWAFLQRPPRWAGALLLDAQQRAKAEERGQGGDDLTTALAFLELPAEQRTGFVRAAIDAGLRAAARVDVRRAVPVPVPRELWVSGALTLLLLAIMSVEVRVSRIVEPPPRFEPLVLAEDDVDLYRRLVAGLAERAEDPASLAAIRRFNTIIEDIAARRLERREAFDRLSELESELARHADLDQEARELGLRDIGRELGRSGLVKNAAEALEQKRLADAAQALRELADRLKKKGNAPSRAEVEKLRSAVERASRVNSERRAAVEQRRRELEEERQSLLKPKTGSQAAGQNANKQAENRRKLERLNREKERAERAARELSDLDRELAKAAEDFKKDTAQGAEDLRRTAEELSKVQRRELSDQEKRDLIQRLREMKEILRQQGQSQTERQRQMARFRERARGRGAKGKGEDAGGQGKGKGQGQPGGSRELEFVEVPSISQHMGAGSPSGSSPEKAGKDASPGQENGSGREPGKGHDSNVQGDPTAPLAGQTQDVTAAAVDTGQGTASAEVIQGAAERGFVGKAYRDVYVQYETVAEQSLEHDNIPPGYRFYVRRYFQLIRPRE